jgi:hypothetical protein
MDAASLVATPSHWRQMPHIAKRRFYAVVPHPDTGQYYLPAAFLRAFGDRDPFL